MSLPGGGNNSSPQNQNPSSPRPDQTNESAVPDQQNQSTSNKSSDVELVPMNNSQSLNKATAAEEGPQSQSNQSTQATTPSSPSTEPTTPHNNPQNNTTEIKPQLTVESKDYSAEAKGDQIGTHQELLNKIRADLDQVLADEESKTKNLLERREQYISKMWWIVLIGYFLTWLAPFLIWIIWFDIKKDVHSYFYARSFFDLIIALSARFVLGVLSVLTTRSDENRITLIHSSGYWCNAIVFTLNIAKLMVFNWRGARGIVLSVISMILSTIIFVLHHKFLPMDEENFDDDEDEKEQAAIRKKLHDEALERADALSRRLTGPALEEHQRVEAERLKSFEYVTKMITRSHIQNRHESRVTATQFLAFLRPYFWPKGVSHIYHFIVVISAVLLLASKACAIIAPLYIGAAVDDLVDKGKMPWNNISIYVCIGLIGQLLKQLQNAIYVKVKQQAFIEISSSLLRHILSLSHSYHHSKSLGKTVRGMDRGLTSADNVVSYLFLLVLPSIGEAIAVFVIFYTKFQSGLLVAIIFLHLVAYAVATVQMTLMRKPLRKRMTSQDNRYHNVLSEALLSYDLIRSFNTEEHEVAKYTSAVVLYQRYFTIIQITLALLNSVQQVIISSTTLCSLFVVCYEVWKGRLKIGAVSSVSGYVMSLYAPLSFLGTVYDMTVSSVIDCRYILQLKQVQPEIVDFENATTLTLPEDGAAPEIEFKNLSFAYPGETGRGVHDVNLKIRGPTAIVGATGSGKSTLTRLLLRFYDPQEGEILINGQDIKYVTNKSLKDAICVIPQQSTMFNTTILENLMYGNQSATFNEVVAATKVAGIYDLIISFPQQFQTVVGSSAKKLSGGEVQRLSLARAILRSLRTAQITQKNAGHEEQLEELDSDGFPVMRFGGIVLADEYSSALDNETENYVAAGLKKLQQGTTTIIIAHRLSTIAGVSNIIVMDEGTVCERGSHSELLALGGKYARLWNLQFENLAEDEIAQLPNSAFAGGVRPPPRDSAMASTIFEQPLKMSTNATKPSDAKK